MMDRRVLFAGSLGVALAPVAGLARSHKKDKQKKKTRKKKGKKRSTHTVSVAAVDAILSPLAEMMWHGLDDDALSLDELEALIASGQRVIVQCSNQSMLGIRALGRQGIKARMINPLYNGAWNDADGWGHTSMEVRVEGRWQVFDMTGNAQLVDSTGRGMDVSTACRTRPIQTRAFASDPLWAWAGPPSSLQAYYEKIFQIPVIEHERFWRFHDAGNRARIEGIGHSWHWADKETWQKLTR